MHLGRSNQEWALPVPKVRPANRVHRDWLALLVRKDHRGRLAPLVLRDCKVRLDSKALPVRPRPPAAASSGVTLASHRLAARPF